MRSNERAIIGVLELTTVMASRMTNPAFLDQDTRHPVRGSAPVVAAGGIEKAKDTFWLAGARLVVEVVGENALVDANLPLDAASVYDLARVLDNEYRPSSRRRSGRHPGCLRAPAYNRAGRLLRCCGVPAATRATRYLADSRFSRLLEKSEEKNHTNEQKY